MFTPRQVGAPWVVVVLGLLLASAAVALEPGLTIAVVNDAPPLDGSSRPLLSALRRYLLVPPAVTPQPPPPANDAVANLIAKVARPSPSAPDVIIVVGALTTAAASLDGYKRQLKELIDFGDKYHCLVIPVVSPRDAEVLGGYSTAAAAVRSVFSNSAESAVGANAVAASDGLDAATNFRSEHCFVILSEARGDRSPEVRARWLEGKLETAELGNRTCVVAFSGDRADFPRQLAEVIAAYRKVVQVFVAQGPSDFGLGDMRVEETAGQPPCTGVVALPRSTDEEHECLAAHAVRIRKAVSGSLRISPLAGKSVRFYPPTCEAVNVTLKRTASRRYTCDQIDGALGMNSAAEGGAATQTPPETPAPEEETPAAQRRASSGSDAEDSEDAPVTKAPVATRRAVQLDLDLDGDGERKPDPENAAPTKPLGDDDAGSAAAPRTAKPGAVPSENAEEDAAPHNRAAPVAESRGRRAASDGEDDADGDVTTKPPATPRSVNLDLDDGVDESGSRRETAKPTVAAAASEDSRGAASSNGDSFSRGQRARLQSAEDDDGDAQPATAKPPAVTARSVQLALDGGDDEQVAPAVKSAGGEDENPVPATPKPPAAASSVRGDDEEENAVAPRRTAAPATTQADSEDDDPVPSTPKPPAVQLALDDSDDDAAAAAAARKKAAAVGDEGDDGHESTKKKKAVEDADGEEPAVPPRRKPAVPAEDGDEADAPVVQRKTPLPPAADDGDEERGVGSRAKKASSADEDDDQAPATPRPPAVALALEDSDDSVPAVTSRKTAAPAEDDTDAPAATPKPPAVALALDEAEDEPAAVPRRRPAVASSEDDSDASTPTTPKPPAAALGMDEAEEEPAAVPRKKAAAADRDDGADGDGTVHQRSKKVFDDGDDDTAALPRKRAAAVATSEDTEDAPLPAPRKTQRAAAHADDGEDEAVAPATPKPSAVALGLDEAEDEPAAGPRKRAAAALSEDDSDASTPTTQKPPAAALGMDEAEEEPAAVPRKKAVSADDANGAESTFGKPKAPVLADDEAEETPSTPRPPAAALRLDEAEDEPVAATTRAPKKAFDDSDDEPDLPRKKATPAVDSEDEPLAPRRPSVPSADDSEDQLPTSPPRTTAASNVNEADEPAAVATRQAVGVGIGTPKKAFDDADEEPATSNQNSDEDRTTKAPAGSTADDGSARFAAEADAQSHSTDEPHQGAATDAAKGSEASGASGASSPPVPADATTVKAESQGADRHHGDATPDPEPVEPAPAEDTATQFVNLFNVLIAVLIVIPLIAMAAKGANALGLTQDRLKDMTGEHRYAPVVRAVIDVVGLVASCSSVIFVVMAYVYEKVRDRYRPQVAGEGERDGLVDEAPTAVVAGGGAVGQNQTHTATTSEAVPKRSVVLKTHTAAPQRASSSDRPRPKLSSRRRAAADAETEATSTAAVSTPVATSGAAPSAGGFAVAASAGAAASSAAAVAEERTSAAPAHERGSSGDGWGSDW